MLPCIPVQEVADDPVLSSAEPQHDDHAACLVLAEEAAAFAADDDGRTLFPVLLHVDAGTIACVAFDINRAAAHGVAHGIADIAVHNDLARIHGVAHGVLCVAVDGDLGAVEVGAQRIAGHAVYGNLLVRHPCGDKSLSAAAGKLLHRTALAQRFVQRFVIQLRNIYHIIPHFQTFFYGFRKKMPQMWQIPLTARN